MRCVKLYTRAAIISANWPTPAVQAGRPPRRLRSVPYFAEADVMTRRLTRELRSKKSTPAQWLGQLFTDDRQGPSDRGRHVVRLGASPCRTRIKNSFDERT